MDKQGMNRFIIADNEQKIGDRECLNCKRPLFHHCELHWPPCCPEKCPGKKHGRQRH